MSGSANPDTGSIGEKRRKESCDIADMFSMMNFT